MPKNENMKDGALYTQKRITKRWGHCMPKKEKGNAKIWGHSTPKKRLLIRGYPKIKINSMDEDL